MVTFLDSRADSCIMHEFNSGCWPNQHALSGLLVLQAVYLVGRQAVLRDCSCSFMVIGGESCMLAAALILCIIVLSGMQLTLCTLLFNRAFLSGYKYFSL